MGGLWTLCFCRSFPQNHNHPPHKKGCEQLNVLVACEESQEVCKAFRAKGHRAFSCDIQDQSGGHPEWHVMGDCLPLLNGRCKFTTQDGREHEQPTRWDLLIAHPPCTYISNAGARWLWAGGTLNNERYNKGLQGKAFSCGFSMPRRKG